MVEVVGQVCFSFLVTLGHWVTRLLLENWQTRFWDSEPVIGRFPSNTHGTLGERIPHNSLELHLTPCMCIVCHMRGLSLSCMSKQNVLSLFLLIPLTKLTNQKKGNYRHLIWYPLWPKPLFSNDDITWRPKVDLGSNLVKFDLRDYFWKRKSVGKTQSMLMHTHICASMLEVCVHILRACAHMPWVCAHI